MSKQIPRGPENLVCPLHKKSMELVCHKCPWWSQIRGMNPNTGAEVDEWNCSLAFLPFLLIEGAKEARHGAAATESFRNEMVRANENRALQSTVQQHLHDFAKPIATGATRATGTTKHQTMIEKKQ